MSLAQIRDTIRCGKCGYEGRVLLAHLRFRWFYSLLAMLLVCTGVGLLALVFLWNYFDRIRRPACPCCGERWRLRPWNGAPSNEADELWRRGAAADRAAFQRGRMAVMVATAAALTFGLLALVQWLMAAL